MRLSRRSMAASNSLTVSFSRNLISAFNNTWSGPRCIVSRLPTSSTAGSSAIILRILLTSALSALSPNSNAPLSRPRSTATPASKIPITMDATGSQYGLCSSCPARIPRKAIKVPAMPAESSRKTVNTVGSLLARIFCPRTAAGRFPPHQFPVRNSPRVQIECGSDRQHHIVPHLGS